MFEAGSSQKIGKKKGVNPEADAGDSRPSPFVWAGLPIQDLIRYRDQIMRHLPPVNLAEMDMEQEMLLQFHALRAVQNDVLDDESVAVNQRAQISNSVSAVLTKLADKQQEIYTSERLKKIERLLITAVEGLPDEVTQKFLDSYYEMLEKL